MDFDHFNHAAAYHWQNQERHNAGSHIPSGEEAVSQGPQQPGNPTQDAISSNIFFGHQNTGVDLFRVLTSHPLPFDPEKPPSQQVPPSHPRQQPLGMAVPPQIQTRIPMGTQMMGMPMPMSNVQNTQKMLNMNGVPVPVMLPNNQFDAGNTPYSQFQMHPNIPMQPSQTLGVQNLGQNFGQQSGAAPQPQFFAPTFSQMMPPLQQPIFQVPQQASSPPRPQQPPSPMVIDTGQGSNPISFPAINFENRNSSVQTQASSSHQFRTPNSSASAGTQMPFAKMGLGNKASQYIPDMPKQIMIARSEPVSRTNHESKPPDPKIQLKKPVDIRAPEGHTGGHMVISDIKQYVSNIVYLGKTSGNANDRIPAAFKHFGGVPIFKGDSKDRDSLKEYVNELTDWCNRFVRMASAGYRRFEDSAADFIKQIKEYETEKENIYHVLEQSGADTSLRTSEILQYMIFEINALTEQKEKLEMHHSECKAVKHEMGEHPTLSEEYQNFVQQYREILERKDQEINIRDSSFKKKTEQVKALQREIRTAKDLVATYQVHISDWVNRNNFIEIHRRTEKDRLEKAEKLSEELVASNKKLQEQNEEMASKIETLKNTIGWNSKYSEDQRGDIEKGSKEDLLFKYRVLFENTQNIVRENKTLKDRLGGEKAAAELKAEYYELLQEKRAIEKEVGEQKVLKTKLGKAYEALEAARAEKAAWKREEEALDTKAREHSEIMHTLQQEHAKVKTAYQKLLADKVTWEKIIENKRGQSTEEFNKLVVEKREIEKTCRELWGSNTTLLAENEELNNEVFVTYMEIEALKGRKEKGAPLMLYRQKTVDNDKDGATSNAIGSAGAEPAARFITEEISLRKVEECCMTMDEVQQIIALDPFRRKLSYCLRRAGDF
ncbi:hypothetical protein ABW20_dc0109619 [Dactylellina cionopaga]|nr:hypothetical protein ABW20_dc0109619 [Dactylellina cionopaga]